MEVRLTYVAARTARADLKGGVLNVRMPRHWPHEEKEAAIDRFRKWAAKREESLTSLPPPVQRAPVSEADLSDLVRRINAETLQVELAGVRIGRARFSRLAQANWQTRILTFSKYAVQSLPDRALRYLIIHELSHLRVPNHSPKFWALVSQFEPAWRHWRQVAQTHFVRAAEAPSRPAAPAPANGFPGAAQRPGTRPDCPDTRPVPLLGSPSDSRPLPGTAGDIAAKALFDDLTGPHGTQLALFNGVVPEYPITI